MSRSREDKLREAANLLRSELLHRGVPVKERRDVHLEAALGDELVDVVLIRARALAFGWDSAE